jgi:arginyl-tRNA synthetase
MIAKTLRKMLEEAFHQTIVARKLEEQELPNFVLERPRLKEHGHWATNLALLVASTQRKNPKQIAQIIVDHIADSEGRLDKIAVAGPGFINFTLSRQWMREELIRLAEAGDTYGRWQIGEGERWQVEFVSANPVGPMHVGHGRWAALGDVLANLLEEVGYKVEREFYINDYGTQMDIFAQSVEARYLELLGEDFEFPDEGYRGEYIHTIAQEILNREGEKWRNEPPEWRREVFKKLAYRQVLDHLKRTLEDFGVTFDVWFSEQELHDSGKLQQTLEELRRRGLAYEKEGALWMRTSLYGDDKDRVLVRSNGAPTYFASDIAYHLNKVERGLVHIIDLWGADHHGYVKRMKAAMEALGYPGVLEIIIGQLVNLKRGGEPVRMSKRTGEMVTFEELLEEVGKDAARYFFLTRSHDSSLDFDIELAKEESQNNPVYYVQYAHARICSILRYGIERGIDVGEHIPPLKILEHLTSEEELDLALKLFEYEEIVRDCALDRTPHRLTYYLEEVASIFHRFYNHHRVISEDEELTRARLFLVKCTLQVIRNCLRLLGISAPETM